MGELTDHRMHTGPLRGLDDKMRRPLGETCDILSDGPGEQLHLLRQIAYILTEILAAPGIHIVAVQAHRANGR